ncbi:hypothetical protein [Microvirga massiliensis]|uniref:hypothetical protein n=1 Tax=Microvirga massiliensis TaxID=1033741 RepID=UPI00062BB22C|nr:hypothetical protein [Microvirga massiliensis]
MARSSAQSTRRDLLTLIPGTDAIVRLLRELSLHVGLARGLFLLGLGDTPIREDFFTPEDER